MITKLLSSVHSFIKQTPVQGNIYITLIIRLLIVMLLFSVCRLGFYWFNLSYFPDITFGGLVRIMMGGLKFDISAILYSNLLIIVLHLLPFQIRYHTNYQKVIKYIYLIFNSIIISANCADFVYYRFTLRRTTASVFSEFAGEGNLGMIFFNSFFQYWYISLFWITLLVALFFLYRTTKVTRPAYKDTLILFYPSALLMFALFAGLTLAGLRGGFRHSTRPITLSNAGEFVKNAREMSIVLNTPFAIFRTLGKDHLEKKSYFSVNELDSIYTPIHKADTSNVFQPKNVVIIILESFGKEHIGFFNHHLKDTLTINFTPFLDSLMTHSTVYWYSFCNGRKSIDALPSVVASIPALKEPYILSHYSDNKLEGLAALLRKKGYHTSFFHGAPNGSMGFKSFMNLAGFEYYFGKNEYNNDEHFDNIWGIWDEEFLQFHVHKLDEFPQPFLSTVFTLSSHHPFKVPERYEGKFADGYDPIHKCVSYTDYALKRFFEEASKMDWYKNTLFVITADHAASHYIPQYKTDVGYYKVPIIFFSPSENKGEIKEQLAQQIDIMPTVLGYLKYDEEYFAFGQNLLDTTSTKFVINYVHDSYQFFEGDYVLQFDNEKSQALYRFKHDLFLTRNLIDSLPTVRIQMERRLKALIQQYNYSLMENKMTVK